MHDEPNPETLATVAAPVEEATTNGPLPQLANNSPNVEAGYMSNWVELGGAPSSMNDQWVVDALGDHFTTPSALAPQLRAAKQEVERRAEKKRVEVPKEISEITRLFKYYEPQSGELRSIGYTPERARWLTGRAERGELQTFEDPYAFAEMRQRGARLYCAATAAYNHRSRNNRVMGKTMAAGISVVGLPLDLMVIEPTISLAQPMRFDSGAVDGAQAFVLPFEAGVRARPFSFLPGLPELKVPVGYLSADSEVVARANASGNNFERWLTMSHMDGFGSLTQSIIKSETPEFPLLTIGGFLTLKGKLGLDMGVAACSQANSYSDCLSDWRQNPGRLISATGQAGGSVTPAAAAPRTGGWTMPGSNGPWSYYNGPWYVDTGSWYAAPLDYSYTIPTRLPDPLASRMLQDNDKSMEVHTSSGMTLSLIAAAGISYEWIEVSADVVGDIRAGVNTIHRFREQEEMLILPPPDNPEAEFAVPVPTMVTTFNVTPASAKEFTFGLGVKLHVAINLGFLHGSYDKELARASATASSGIEEWPENRRLRMDTAISDGVNAHFNTLSHLPRDQAYWTYENIEQCQAPQTTPVEGDPACGAANRDRPAPGEAQAIPVNLCLWREEYFLPPDFNAADLLDNQCWEAMKPWLTSGISSRQDWHEARGPVIARALQAENQADMAALQSALAQCDQLYGNAGRTQDFQNLLHFSLCDGSAKLIDQLMEPTFQGGGADPGPAGEPDACD